MNKPEVIPDDVWTPDNAKLYEELHAKNATLKTFHTSRGALAIGVEENGKKYATCLHPSNINAENFRHLILSLGQSLDDVRAAETKA